MKSIKDYICQCCRKGFNHMDKIVVVSYQRVSEKGNLYFESGQDFFHEKCDKAFRNNE